MWRQRKKYRGPRHPWKKERIEEEHKLAKEFGIRRMRELWKTRALLRNWQRQAKEIIGMREGAKKDEAQKLLLTKLQRYGLLTEDADVDDVLSLTPRDVLDKRLETILFKKGMALTPLQARQFIAHGKVQVNGKKLDAPSYLVKIDDDISFIPGFAPKLKSEISQAQETDTEQPEAKEASKEVQNG